MTSAVGDGAPGKLETRTREIAASDGFTHPEHRLAAGGTVTHGRNTGPKMHSELPLCRECEHFIWRLELDLEWLSIRKQRGMRVAINHAGHEYQVAAVSRV
jgi:hypothetical protein